MLLNMVTHKMWQFSNYSGFGENIPSFRAKQVKFLWLPTTNPRFAIKIGQSYLRNYSTEQKTHHFYFPHLSSLLPSNPFKKSFNFLHPTPKNKIWTFQFHQQLKSTPTLTLYSHSSRPLANMKRIHFYWPLLSQPMSSNSGYILVIVCEFLHSISSVEWSQNQYLSIFISDQVWKIRAKKSAQTLRPPECNR